MIVPGAGVRAYLACGVTDMRTGIESLAAIAQDVLGRKPTGGGVIAFRGKHGTVGVAGPPRLEDDPDFGKALEDLTVQQIVTRLGTEDFAITDFLRVLRLGQRVLAPRQQTSRGLGDVPCNRRN